MSNLVTLEIPELKGIEISKANQIKATFEPMVQMLTEFEIQFNEVISESEKEITRELTAKAKRIRLDIGKVRIETGKLKDKQKEYIKLEDRAIMGVHNILVYAVKEKEDKLKSIEDYFEIQEQKRLDALQSERVELLSKYVEDAHERTLCVMEDDVWNAYLNTKKKEYEDRIAAEKKAEEDRIACEKAEAEEREKQRLENIQLKADAEKREAQIKAENEARERADAAERAKQAKEQADREAKEQADREAYEAKLKAEREEKARIEAELQAKREAEEKALKEAEEAKQAELNKGDADKVKDLISDLENLKTKYQFKSAKNVKMYSEVSALLGKVVDHIKK